MGSVGQDGQGFDLLAWESAVYGVCRPPSSWGDLGDWESDVLVEDQENGDQSFSEAVSLDTARGCLRLLCRLWANPGDRVDYGLPEAVLWRWLRRQVIGLVGRWAIDADGTDGWNEEEPRKAAAVQLRGLLPAEPSSRDERDRTYADRLDGIELELGRANDVLAHLVVRTHAFSQPMRPWPTLATLAQLTDELIAVRAPVPTPAPVAIAQDAVILAAPVMRTVPRSGGRRPADFNRRTAEETFRQLWTKYRHEPSPSEVYAGLPELERDKGSETTFRSRSYYGGWKLEPDWGSHIPTTSAPSADRLGDGLTVGMMLGTGEQAIDQ